MKLSINDEKLLEVKLDNFTNNTLSFELHGKKFTFQYQKIDNNSYKLLHNNKIFKIDTIEHNQQVEIFQQGQYAKIKEKKQASNSVVQVDLLQLEYHSPMPGKISKIQFKIGEQVKSGDVLMYLEAMKMEHPIKAKMSGVVESVPVSLGAQVNQNQLLVKIKKL
jgi:acetyl/propionyl-CoA carboxylase alpha subunit